MPPLAPRSQAFTSIAKFTGAEDGELMRCVLHFIRYKIERVGFYPTLTLVRGYVHPRTRKRISNIGIGIPISHNNTQPTAPFSSFRIFIFKPPLPFRPFNMRMNVFPYWERSLLRWMRCRGRLLVQKSP